MPDPQCSSEKKSIDQKLGEEKKRGGRPEGSVPGIEAPLYSASPHCQPFPFPWPVGPRCSDWL